ncbi:type IV secretory pathway VirB10-like protein [Bradyrhizobium sp. USDA 4354]
MSDELKDAGLVAMISSILGGNKRADSVAPPPLAEVPPIAPADVVEPPETPTDPTAAKAENAPDPAPDAKPVEQPAKIATTRDGKQLLPAEAIADLVLGELRKMESFPPSGVSVTVYGYRHWNAMLTFAPFSTSFQNATRFRKAMPDLVFKLRRFVELEI